MKFEVTENAFKRVSYIKLREKNEKLVLKVSILGGGCSGLQYQFKFVDEYESDAFVFEGNGSRIVVDKESALFLDNSALDYIEELGHARFEVLNPNSTAKCGCGKSFAM